MQPLASRLVTIQEYSAELTILWPESIRDLSLRYMSDQVVHVIEVARGSVAERSGIEAGDFIIAINDRITSGVDDVHRLLSIAPLDLPLDLTLVRGRTRFKVRISWN